MQPVPTNLQEASWQWQAHAQRHTATRVAKFPYYVFLGLYIFSLLNLSGLIMWIAFRNRYFAINPIIFVICALLVASMTRPRRMNGYFVMAWIFWIIYALGGLIGPYSQMFSNPYGVAQIVFKIWITAIGIPWLAYRIATPQNITFLIKLTYWLIGFGSLLAIAQLFYPDIVERITQSRGRGSSLWIDPNLCGAMLTVGLLLNLMFPMRSTLLNWGLRACYVVGVVATLSRGGIAALILSIIVYGAITMRPSTLFKIGIGIVIVSVVGTAMLGGLLVSNIHGVAERAAQIQDMLQGRYTSEAHEGRRLIWQLGFEACQEEWLLGRGHGSMNRVVPVGMWVGPHNYFLYVWGNSGLIALVAFLAFMVWMTIMALRCRPATIRAGMLAMVVAIVLLAMSSHSLFHMQFFGAVFALFMLIDHFHSKKTSPRRGMPVAALPPGGTAHGGMLPPSPALGAP